MNDSFTSGNSGDYFVSLGGVQRTGGIEPTAVVIGTCFVSLTAKVLLEGPFNTGLLLMNDALRLLPDFPLSEPYTTLGLPPTSTAVISASLLAATGNNAIVDWVLVELRDAATGVNVLVRSAALVQRDGDVVGLDGTSSLTLPIAPGTYHVAVRHRNHLGCMTATPLPLTTSTTPLDLTVATTVTFGTEGRKTQGVLQFLWAGNVTPDATLRYAGSNNDRDPILVAIGGSVPTATGYRKEDITMDGQTKYAGSANDRDVILVNIGGSVPTATRAQQLP